MRDSQQMTLTKAHIVDKVYNTQNLARNQSRDAVNTFLRIIKKNLITGEDILLSGFGKFRVREKNARRGRNPQTGEDLMLDARRVVTFKPSGKLRDRLNGW